jgi:hypothetical protein
MGFLINQQKIARDVVVVGASAGGIRAVIEILSRLPGDLPAFIGVVIHRGADTRATWADVVGMKTNLRVVEPTHQLAAAGSGLSSCESFQTCWETPRNTRQVLLCGSASSVGHAIGSESSSRIVGRVFRRQPIMGPSVVRPILRTSMVPTVSDCGSLVERLTD